MMLAYQPVRSLATINIGIAQGLSAGKRIIPIIDAKNLIEPNDSKIKLKIKSGNIEFKNLNFSYSTNLQNKVLKM